MTVRLTSGRSESVGRYSADQVNEAMGRALKFVQTGGREHGPMELHDTPRSPHSEHDPRAGRDMVSQTVRPPSAAENQEAWAGYEDLNGSRPEMLYHWTTRENAAQILSGEGDHAIFLPGEEGNSSAEVFFSPGQEDEMTEERLPDDAVQIAVAPDYSDMRWMPGDRGARGNDVVYRGNLATDRVKIVQNSAHEQGPKLEEHDTSNSPHREHGPGAGSRTGNDADIETAYDERAEAVGNYTQLMILVEQKGKEHLRPKMEAALQRYGQALERVRELDPEGGKAAGPGRPLEVGWTGGGSTEEKAPSSPGIGRGDARPLTGAANTPKRSWSTAGGWSAST
ncbi:MAG: hypothetical protein IIB19_07725 [Chloroflexi bacterium]|nr:hypothetical protein [Chloroflexota bacterium]